MSMKRTLKKLLRETDAQDLAEYGIALAVVGTAVGLIVVAIGANTTTLWARGLQVLITAALGG